MFKHFSSSDVYIKSFQIQLEIGEICICLILDASNWKAFELECFYLKGFTFDFL